MPGPISLTHATDEPMSATDAPIFDPTHDDDGGVGDGDDMMTNDARTSLRESVVEYE